MKFFFLFSEYEKMQYAARKDYNNQVQTGARILQAYYTSGPVTKKKIEEAAGLLNP